MRKIDEKIEKNLKESIHSVEIELQRKLAYKEISREEFMNELDDIAKEK